MLLSTTNEPVIVLAFLAVNVTAGLSPATCPRSTLNSLLLLDRLPGNTCDSRSYGFYISSSHA